MLTEIKLMDVNGQPMAKLELPQQKVGDPITLRFKLERKNGGRTEQLTVDGSFMVTACGTDASSGVPRQALSVESLGKPPVWVSVKNEPSERRLGPAIHPRTPV